MEALMLLWIIKLLYWLYLKSSPDIKGPEKENLLLRTSLVYCTSRRFYHLFNKHSKMDKYKHDVNGSINDFQGLILTRTVSLSCSSLLAHDGDCLLYSLTNSSFTVPLIFQFLLFHNYPSSPSLSSSILPNLSPNPTLNFHPACCSITTGLLQLFHW